MFAESDRPTGKTVGSALDGVLHAAEGVSRVVGTGRLVHGSLWTAEWRPDHVPTPPP